jgi:hypothetical protein
MLMYLKEVILYHRPRQRQSYVPVGIHGYGDITADMVDKNTYANYRTVADALIAKKPLQEVGFCEKPPVWGFLFSDGAGHDHIVRDTFLKEWLLENDYRKIYSKDKRAVVKQDGISGECACSFCIIRTDKCDIQRVILDPFFTVNGNVCYAYAEELLPVLALSRKEYSKMGAIDFFEGRKL